MMKFAFSFRTVLSLVICAMILLSFSMMTGCSSFKNLSLGDKDRAAEEEEGLKLSEGGDPILTEGILISNLGLPEQLTAGAYDNGLANWHPQGDRIVYQSNQDGTWQIYEMDLILGSVTRLIETLSTDENPIWSEDGEDIIFVSTPEGNPEWERDILVYNPAADIVIPLINSPGDDWYPTVYENEKFFFLSEREADLELPVHLRPNAVFIGYIDGDPPRMVADEELDLRSPNTIDDDRILALNDRKQLVIYNRDTYSTKPVTPSRFECGSPDYDPINKLAVVPAKIGYDNYLLFIDMDNGIYQRFEPKLQNLRYPQFSPDGSTLLITAEVDDHFQIFRIQLR